MSQKSLVNIHLDHVLKYATAPLATKVVLVRNVLKDITGIDRHPIQVKNVKNASVMVTVIVVMKMVIKTERIRLYHGTL